MYSGINTKTALSERQRKFSEKGEWHVTMFQLKASQLRLEVFENKKASILKYASITIEQLHIPWDACVPNCPYLIFQDLPPLSIKMLEQFFDTPLFLVHMKKDSLGSTSVHNTYHRVSRYTIKFLKDWLICGVPPLLTHERRGSFRSFRYYLHVKCGQYEISWGNISINSYCPAGC